MQTVGKIPLEYIFKNTLHLQNTGGGATYWTIKNLLQRKSSIGSQH